MAHWDEPEQFPIQNVPEINFFPTRRCEVAVDDWKTKPPAGLTIKNLTLLLEGRFVINVDFAVLGADRKLVILASYG